MGAPVIRGVGPEKNEGEWDEKMGLSVHHSFSLRLLQLDVYRGSSRFIPVFSYLIKRDGNFSRKSQGLLFLAVCGKVHHQAKTNVSTFIIVVVGVSV